jgi:ComF family protein
MKGKKTDIPDLKEGSKRWLRWIADILFPRRCPFCDGVLMYGGPPVCGRCRSRISYVGERYCMKCGKALSGATEEYCPDCIHTAHSFDRGRSLYVYDDLTRASIARFKYKGRREYAEFYGADIVRHMSGYIKRCQPDVLIPIPISERKRRSRGYNQAELIADQISVYTGIPVNTTLIVRIRDTSPMKELSRVRRMKNLKGAFKMAYVDVQWKNALLIDDIYTTGSTVDAVSAILKKAGINKVYFMALSSGAPV